MTFIKNWFSNMLSFDKPLLYQRIEYYTVENFYQAMKLPKGNVDKRDYIASLDPYGAKREGRKLQIRPDWDEIKLDVMEYVLRFKFAPGTSWHSQLMATGEAEIVELNNWNDEYWGVCVRTGRGQNHLGKLLMKLREEFKLDSK